MKEKVDVGLTERTVLELLLADLLATALVFAPLERLAPIRKGRPSIRDLTILDLCHVFYSSLMITGGLVVLVGIFIAAFMTPALREFGEVIRTQPLALQFVEATILADLGFYTAHRTFHAVPALWKIHKVHHGIEELDWLAAHRVHPIDQVLTMTASLAPVFLLGFSPEAIALHGAVYKWQSHLIHSNAKVGFGPFRHLFASPQFHHWHHANHKEARDRNFAGQLPFIDRIFGTLYSPQHRMPERYGVDDPPPTDYLGQLAYPFMGISRSSPPEGAKARS